MAHLSKDSKWVFDKFQPVCKKCRTDARVTDDEDIENLVFRCPKCKTEELVSYKAGEDQYLKLFDLLVRNVAKACFFSVGDEKPVRSFFIGIAEHIATVYDRPKKP